LRNRFLSATSPYLYLLPAVAVILVFQLLPMFYALYLSFFRWDLINVAGPQFMGLRNYINLLLDPSFLLSLLNTAIFSTGSIVIGLGLSLLVAVLLSRGIRGLGIFRTSYFIPYVASMAAVAIVWKWIFHPAGLLNISLRPLFEFISSRFSVELGPIQWLRDQYWARVAVVMFVVWKTMGFNILIFLTRLLDIDQSYYEAAEIDGAGTWAKFRFVTWPLLMPTTVFLLTVSIIFSLQMFVPVYILTPDGGPLNATNTTVFYLYQSAFNNFLFGYASSMAYILFLIILGITLVQRALLRKQVAYED